MRWGLKGPFDRGPFARDVFGAGAVTVVSVTVEDPGDGTLEIVTNGDGTLDITVSGATQTEYNGTYNVTLTDLDSGPVNLVPAAITGTATEGQTLTRDYPGLWVYAGTGFSVAQVWQDDDVNISGDPSGNSYTLTASEVGGTIELQETATDSNGTSDPVDSNALGPVAASSPESGLTLTGTIAEGSSNFATTTFDETAPVVFACDFTGLDGSSGGIILETGALAGACYIGFRANGDFMVRFGDGGSGSPVDPLASYLLIAAASSPPSGDGTLVASFDNATPTLRVWWAGVELSGAVNGAAGDWTATGSSSNYLSTSSQLAGGELGSPVVTYSTASGLRYYTNQSVT